MPLLGSKTRFENGDLGSSSTFAQADHRDAFSGPTKEMLLNIQEKSTSFSYTSRDALSVLRPGLKMVTLAPPPHFAQADQSRAAYLAMTIKSQTNTVFVLVLLI